MPLLRGQYCTPIGGQGSAPIDIVAEQRGIKAKKRLSIDPVEAEVVRLIFKLFREGDGKSGPLGVKAVTCWLNERGYRTRGGAHWGIGQLHKMLTNSTYKGE